MAGVIYTDGVSYDVSRDEARHLMSLGLIFPHPGAGHDGIDNEDNKLTQDTAWQSVMDALADLHHAEPLQS